MAATEIPRISAEGTQADLDFVGNLVGAAERCDESGLTHDADRYRSEAADLLELIAADLRSK